MYMNTRRFTKDEIALIDWIVAHTYKEQRQLQIMLKCGAIVFINTNTNLPDGTPITPEDVLLLIDSEVSALITV